MGSVPAAELACPEPDEQLASSEHPRASHKTRSITNPVPHTSGHNPGATISEHRTYGDIAEAPRPLVRREGQRDVQRAPVRQFRAAGPSRRRWVLSSPNCRQIAGLASPAQTRPRSARAFRMRGVFEFAMPVVLAKA